MATGTSPSPGCGLLRGGEVWVLIGRGCLLRCEVAFGVGLLWRRPGVGLIFDWRLWR
jgi:hypothetical protein